jgi:hypothetical protein
MRGGVVKIKKRARKNRTACVHEAQALLMLRISCHRHTNIFFFLWGLGTFGVSSCFGTTAIRFFVGT